MANISFDDLIPKGNKHTSGPALSFDDLIPAEGAAASPEPKTYRGLVVPYEQNEETGDWNFAVPRLVENLYEAAKGAITAPGRAMSGELKVTGPDGRASPEAIAEAANVATIFAPISPAAGTGKAVAANAAPAATQGMESAAAANRIGVDLPRAVASESPVVQQTGKLLTNVPIGGTPLRVASQKAIDQLGGAANRVQEGYGSGNVANAGAAARQGMTDYATKTLSGRVTDAYNAVDGLITQNVTTPLSNTAKTALEIGTSRKNATLPDSRAVGVVRRALESTDGLNYQGIKDLRSSVREMMDNPSLAPAETSQAELKRIYGALTEDLKASVARSGGEKASTAFEQANQLAARTARERESLSKVLGRDASDEKVFDRITTMAGSGSRADRVNLARVRSSVSDETWNDLASGVISRLGRDADGNFSPNRFITGYGRLSSEGKSALFGGQKQLASALDDIATVSRQFKTLDQYANPSGTGQAATGAAYLSGVFLDPVTVVGSVAGARVMSSLMAKPASAKALAAYAKAYERNATKPSEASTQALANTARAVAGFIGHETGQAGVASQVFPSISRVRQVPAEDGGEHYRVPEAQNGSVDDKLRMLPANEI
ncbi:hypothetical protein LH464_21300 [Neorhizobium sp. T786]|uniref:hypothetical protein n=1 Tax=Pseudorhizobium xiangyangii TaxID=2883104 RepID=UPI001CFF968D|nr:hypothetical protein [Neorhizobium xiangyangii]MCB5205006.1 hypothetical protein [Neorhizobium xiangyangii]